jgi:hypothetical protein
MAHLHLGPTHAAPVSEPSSIPTPHQPATTHTGGDSPQTQRGDTGGEEEHGGGDGRRRARRHDLQGLHHPPQQALAHRRRQGPLRHHVVPTYSPSIPFLSSPRPRRPDAPPSSAGSGSSAPRLPSCLAAWLEMGIRDPPPSALRGGFPLGHDGLDWMAERSVSAVLLLAPGLSVGRIYSRRRYDAYCLSDLVLSWPCDFAGDL